VFEIGDRRARPREDQEVRLTQFADDRHVAERDAGLPAQWIEVVEIGDARQMNHRDVDCAAGVGTVRLAAFEGHGVFLGERHVLDPRNDAEDRAPGASLEILDRGREE